MLGTRVSGLVGDTRYRAQLMKVTALGTGTGPLIRIAGLRVSSSNHSGTFLLDGGSGTLKKLAQVECTQFFLPQVFILIGIQTIVRTWYRCCSRCTGIRADKTIIDICWTRFCTLFRCPASCIRRWIEPRGGSVQVTECSTSTLESHRVFGIELTTAPAVHTAGSLHIKIQDLKTNTTLVYSGILLHRSISFIWPGMQTYSSANVPEVMHPQFADI